MNIKQIQELADKIIKDLQMQQSDAKQKAIMLVGAVDGIRLLVEEINRGIKDESGESNN